MNGREWKNWEGTASIDWDGLHAKLAEMEAAAVEASSRKTNRKRRAVSEFSSTKFYF